MGGVEFGESFFARSKCQIEGGFGQAEQVLNHNVKKRKKKERLSFGLSRVSVARDWVKLCPTNNLKEPSNRYQQAANMK